MARKRTRSSRNFDEARKRARSAADKAVGDELDHVVAASDELERVFDSLKQQDPATRSRLMGIVQDATHRNESIGTLIERLRAAGEAGIRLAETVEGLTPAGLLKRLGRGGFRS